MTEGRFRHPNGEVISGRAAAPMAPDRDDVLEDGRRCATPEAPPGARPSSRWRAGLAMRGRRAGRGQADRRQDHQERHDHRHAKLKIGLSMRRSPARRACCAAGATGPAGRDGAKGPRPAARPATRRTRAPPARRAIRALRAPTASTRPPGQGPPSGPFALGAERDRTRPPTSTRQMSRLPPGLYCSGDRVGLCDAAATRRSPAASRLRAAPRRDRHGFGPDGQRHPSPRHSRGLRRLDRSSTGRPGAAWAPVHGHVGLGDVAVSGDLDDAGQTSQ